MNETFVLAVPLLLSSFTGGSGIRSENLLTERDPMPMFRRLLAASLVAGMNTSITFRQRSSDIRN
jgi:hypothetical protein